MAVEPSALDVLMSIHPRHADQILSGVKTVEFRRRSPKRPVAHIVIYATSPVQRIVALARVMAIVEGSLETLWAQFGSVGGVTRSEFDEYFAGVSEGSALVLAEVRPLNEPSEPGGLVYDAPPPQSFRYLPAQPARGLAHA